MAVKMEQEQKEGKCTTSNLEKYVLAEEVTREILEEFIQVIKVSGKDKLEIIWKENIKK